MFMLAIKKIVTNTSKSHVITIIDSLIFITYHHFTDNIILLCTQSDAACKICRIHITAMQAL